MRGQLPRTRAVSPRSAAPEQPGPGSGISGIGGATRHGEPATQPEVPARGHNSYRICRMRDVLDAERLFGHCQVPCRRQRAYGGVSRHGAPATQRQVPGRDIDQMVYMTRLDGGSPTVYPFSSLPFPCRAHAMRRWQCAPLSLRAEGGSVPSAIVPAAQKALDARGALGCV
jgi:hypothetical protein